MGVDVEELILQLLEKQNEEIKKQGEDIKEIKSLFFDADIVVALRTIKENRNALIEIFNKHNSTKEAHSKIALSTLEKMFAFIIVGILSASISFILSIIQK